MRTRALVLLFSALLSGCSTGGLVHVPDGGRLPISLSLIGDDDCVPEEFWTHCRPDAFPEDAKRALADWEKVRPWVEKQITPDLVRALSNRAKREMQSYNSVPPLAGVNLQPVASKEVGDGHRYILLKGTVDTLPPLNLKAEHRWLRIYMVYRSEIWSVVRVILKIESERLE
jgi:hypothetical protein